MATLNPLEQKARSSFIKGFLLAILIGLVVAGFLGMQLFKKNGEEKERLAGQKSVMIFKQSVKSGDLITSDMFQTIKVDANAAASDAVTAFQDLQNYFLRDVNGNTIARELDKSGKEVKYYIYISAEAKNGETPKYELEENEGSYHYKDSKGNIQYVTLENTALVAKIDVSSKTIASKDMFAASSEQTSDDLREQEYNMIVLPSNLVANDTIDIRLRLPSGLDYVVVSKKKVTLPEGTDNPGNTMFIKATESEILTMSAAIVDAYKIQGSKLYAVKYTDPGIQKGADSTYIPSSDTLTLIASDPNIVEKAKTELINYYNANYNNYRTGVANSLTKITSDQQDSSVQSGTSSEISTQSQQRQSYLESVAGE